MAGIDYVGTRYEELVDLLEGWGYAIVPDPTASKWAEIVQSSPVTGLVKLRGERGSGGEKLSFSITEFWVEGNLGEEAALVRAGASLTTYHYHGQAPSGGVRWCLFTEGHPEMPYHCHPFPNPTAAPHRADPIEPEGALIEFETLAYLEAFGPSEDE